jgi:hypothetical protein
MLRLDRVFAVFLVTAFLYVSASAQHPTIGTCTTIDKPGSYKLEKVITATVNDLIPYPVPFAPNTLLACIVISADFVALDMQGFTIIGPGSGNGIANVPPTRAATVSNGTVTQFTNGMFFLVEVIQSKRCKPWTTPTTASRWVLLTKRAVSSMWPPRCGKAIRMATEALASSSLPLVAA